jgi:TolB-like protein/DNA-binding winged helix-turn-helix (wHTH) protein
LEEFLSSVRLIRFGGFFEVDLRSGEISKRGVKIRLQGQPFLLLITLLKKQGEIVSREELRRTLWPEETFVDFDHGLDTAVRKLREVLGDSASNPRFVETIPRRGYRFIAPVETIGESETVSAPNQAAPNKLEPATGSRLEARDEDQVEHPGAAMESPRTRWPLSWKFLGLVFLLLSVGFMSFLLRSRPSTLIRSLVVLPLEDLSGDPSQEYFSDGMTDELIAELGQIGKLRVISRTSAMTYKGVRRPLPEIARELNVDAVVEGTVLRLGNQVRITAQLIQASSDKHLWGHSYEVELRDILTVEKEVARAIAEQIRLELNPHEQRRLDQPQAVNAEAYESYLKGRFFWNKRTGEGLKKAIDYFSQAIQDDPNYAPAYAGLADSYALAGDWKYGVLAPREAYPRAKAAAKKAIALNSTLGEAHISFAFSLEAFDWDFESAGREFAQGIELSPGYATGHEWFGWHLAALGRNRDAIAEVRKAENLDPLSLIIGADLAEELLVARRYDEAIKQSRKALYLDPFFANGHYVLGQALTQEHIYNEAIKELQIAVQLSPQNTAFTATLAYAYAVSGMTNEAVKLLNDLKTRSPAAFSSAPEIALIYVGLGQKDQAMASLEKAYDERFSPWVLMRPSFDSLRSDPRFQNLLRRIGIIR